MGYSGILGYGIFYFGIRVKLILGYGIFWTIYFGLWDIAYPSNQASVAAPGKTGSRESKTSVIRSFLAQLRRSYGAVRIQ